MLGRWKCASIKSMILALKLLIKLWIFKIFSIIWFYLLDHCIIWDFQNDIKQYSQSKILDFIKALKKKINKDQKWLKNHAFSGGTGKNGLIKIFWISLSFIYLFKRKSAPLNNFYRAALGGAWREFNWRSHRKADNETW